MKTSERLSVVLDIGVAYETGNKYYKQIVICTRDDIDESGYVPAKSVALTFDDVTVLYKLVEEANQRGFE